MYVVPGNVERLGNSSGQEEETMKQTIVLVTQRRARNRHVGAVVFEVDPLAGDDVHPEAGEGCGTHRSRALLPFWMSFCK